MLDIKKLGRSLRKQGASEGLSMVGLTEAEASKVIKKLKKQEQFQLSTSSRYIRSKKINILTVPEIYLYCEAVTKNYFKSLRQKGLAQDRYIGELFCQHLSYEEKVELIYSFSFSSEVYTDYHRDLKTKHLCRKAAQYDPSTRTNNPCSTSSNGYDCLCEAWLNSHIIKVDKYVRLIVLRLYHMRCSLFHYACHPGLAPDIDSTYIGMYLNERHSKRRTQIAMYETTMTSKRLFQITLKVLKGFYLNR